MRAVGQVEAFLFVGETRRLFFVFVFFVFFGLRVLCSWYSLNNVNNVKTQYQNVLLQKQWIQPSPNKYAISIPIARNIRLQTHSLHASWTEPVGASLFPWYSLKKASKP